MAEQVSRRHHTVPRFYLDGFARGGQVTTVDLTNGRSYPGSTKDASVWTDFYDLPSHPDGSDAFEKALSRVEAAAAAVFRKIIDTRTWPLPETDRCVLAEFITLQTLRVPGERRKMEEIVAATTQAEYTMGGPDYSRRRMEEQAGRPLTDSEFDQLWDEVQQPGGPPIKLTPEAHIEQIVNLLPDLLTYIAGRPWTLFCFERRSLLTCDTPLMAVPDGLDKFSGGLKTAKALTFPLTRKLGIFMGDPLLVAEALRLEWSDVAGGRADTIMAGSTAAEKLFNTRTIASANRFIFHHPDDSIPKLHLPGARTRQMDISNTNFTRRQT